MSAFGGKADMTQIYAMSVRVPLGATPRVMCGSMRKNAADSLKTGLLPVESLVTM